MQGRRNVWKIVGAWVQWMVPGQGLSFALVRGGHFAPPLWFFVDSSKTKGSSVTKLGIPFH